MGDARTHPPGAATPLPATHDARELVQADGTAHIRLDGQIYMLRITRAGKLILTKSRH